MSEDLISKAIVTRMSSGEPFTYGELCALTVAAKDQGRTADKLIQRWRRLKWIKMDGRRGRAPLWHLIRENLPAEPTP